MSRIDVRGRSRATQLQSLSGGRRSLTFTAGKDEGAPIDDDGFVDLVPGRPS